MISRTGDTIIVSIGSWNSGIQNRIYSYKYNSTQDKFILTTDSTIDIVPMFTGISDDGNVVATTSSAAWSQTPPYLCYLIRTINSVTTAQVVHFDVGEGVNNTTYYIRGINVSGDGTKLFIAYSDNTQTAPPLMGNKCI